jgi:hypothetical protein
MDEATDLGGATHEDTAEVRSTRSRFIRQVGMTLAAAVGFGALAARASASPFRCCPDSSCGSCSGGTYCLCDCSGTGTQSYCWQIQQGCIPSGGGCIACPC